MGMRYNDSMLPMECIVLADAGADKRTRNTIWQADLYEEEGWEYFRGAIVKFFPDVAIIRFNQDVVLPVDYRYIRFATPGMKAEVQNAPASAATLSKGW